MSKYIVRIIASEPCKPETILIGLPFKEVEKKEGCMYMMVGFCLRKGYCDGLEYHTAEEENAMAVYARAKRNLDLSRYTVTLELPGKEGE